MLAAAGLAVALAGVALAFALADGGPAPSAQPATAEEEPPTLDGCADAPEDELRACYLDALRALVAAAPDAPRAAEEAAEWAWADDGFLLPNCHGLMHTVGREYAAERGVTLATLMEHLPQSNDPGCPAGFAHGVISAIAPELGTGSPRAAVDACEDAGTSYQRYSCRHGFGHAFMRAHGEELEPALDLCAELGPPAPECAQGVFHDYWFSVAGFDGTEPAEEEPVTDPRELCAVQREEFVRACWHRAFLESRPVGFELAAGAELEALCAGLRGVQRSGCLTAASAIGPPQPARQLALCSELAGPDALDCIRGVKVQNLLNEPEETYVDEIRYCDLFLDRVRRGCYRLYGQALAVLTDGRFDGCAELDPEAARACAAGTQALEDPLETFS